MRELSFSWKKLGRIFQNPGRHPKLATHASNPMALHLHGDLYRIYYNGRDAQNRSSIGAFDFDFSAFNIMTRFDEPFLMPNEQASYCVDGISIGCSYVVGEKRYLLFMGWQCPPHGHWRGDIGRVEILRDGSLGPLPSEPFFKPDNLVDLSSLSYPWVHQRADKSYLMWYGSTHTWDAGNLEMIHPIHCAHSTDGEIWQRQGVSVPFVMSEAQAFSRPTIVKIEDAGYHMWYSFRSGGGDKYKIGYAHSEDLEKWVRLDDQSGIKASNTGWDSEMLEYPFVFSHNDQIFMLYNGNEHGKSGIGLAELEIY